MREPLNSTERLCVMGERCECRYIDKGNPFTAVEFILPGEKVSRLVPGGCQDSTQR